VGEKSVLQLKDDRTALVACLRLGDGMYASGWMWVEWWLGILGPLGGECWLMHLFRGLESVLIDDECAMQLLVLQVSVVLVLVSWWRELGGGMCGCSSLLLWRGLELGSGAYLYC
jgi:hypothetical protein